MIVRNGTFFAQYTGVLRDPYETPLQFEGDFKDGRPHGSGVMMLPNGDTVRGTFVRGVAKKGVLETAVLRYEGDLNNFNASGQGRAVYRDDGSVYEGQWRGNTWNGKGVFMSATGLSRMEGIFANGEFLQGTAVTYEEASFTKVVSTGSFRKGKLHGQGGRIWYRDGDNELGRANGTFENDRIVFGRCALFDGTVIEGNIRRCRLNGAGRFVCKEGSTVEGTFVDGAPVGTVTMTFAPGSSTVRYEGQVRDKGPHGKGKLTFADGSVFSGMLEHGQPHGRGCLSASGSSSILVNASLPAYLRKGGQKWEGAFDRGKMTGEFVLTLSVGTRCEGRIEGTAFFPRLCVFPSGFRLDMERNACLVVESESVSDMYRQFREGRAVSTVFGALRRNVRIAREAKEAETRRNTSLETRKEREEERRATAMRERELEAVREAEEKERRKKASLEKKERRMKNRLRKRAALAHLRGIGGSSDTTDESPPVPCADAEEDDSSPVRPPEAEEEGSPPVLPPDGGGEDACVLRCDSPSTARGDATCIVCFEGAKTHAAAPCGHLCACAVCSRQMSECPYCRGDAVLWVRITEV